MPTHTKQIMDGSEGKETYKNSNEEEKDFIGKILFENIFKKKIVKIIFRTP